MCFTKPHIPKFSENSQIYRLYFSLLIPVLIAQYNDWWPYLPLLKKLPVLLLSGVYVRNHFPERDSAHFRNTFTGLILSSLGFFLISYHPIEVTNFFAMLFFITGRLCFFYNIRRVSGFLTIRSWKNFLGVILVAFTFFLFVAIYLIPEMSFLITLAVVLFVFIDTLLVSAIYFLWRDKKLHATGIWAIIILFVFDLTGAFSMYIKDLNDHFAISVYFGYLSIYLMYRFMLDLKMVELLKNTEL